MESSHDYDTITLALIKEEVLYFTKGRKRILYESIRRMLSQLIEIEDEVNDRGVDPVDDDTIMFMLRSTLEQEFYRKLIDNLTSQNVI